LEDLQLPHLTDFEMNGEFRTLLRHAFHRNFASVSFDDLLGDVESLAEASDIGARRSARKALKDLARLILGNAYPMINDLHRGLTALTFNPHLNRLAVAILDGVGD